jgi:hypothetical protein
VAFEYRQTAIVCFDSDRFNSADSSDRIENLANFIQRHLQFPQSDDCKLIQYLNAYDAPRSE